MSDNIPTEDTIVKQPKKHNKILKFIKGIFISDKKIGELNGKWAALFKACMIVGMSWCIWVTSVIYQSSYHMDGSSNYEQRLDTLEIIATTEVDNLHELQARVETHYTHMTEAIDALPPPEWQHRIESVENDFKSVEADIKQISSDVTKVDKQNTAEHNEILISLEGISTILEFLKTK